MESRDKVGYPGQGSRERSSVKAEYLSAFDGGQIRLILRILQTGESSSSNRAPVLCPYELIGFASISGKVSQATGRGNVPA